MKNLKPYEYLMSTSRESACVRETFLEECGENLVRAAEMLGECIRKGKKILILGNGGSAADAPHMAAEMVGKMLIDRRPLPAIALTTDSSSLTAIGNDFGYDKVFLKQIQALAQKEDVVIAISTSGMSQNVVLAVGEARRLGCRIIGLTGGLGGSLKEICDICLCASSGGNSSRIQETHIFAVHSLVDLLDRFFLEST